MQALRIRQLAPQAADQACAQALVTPVLPQPPDLPQHTCPTATAIQAHTRPWTWGSGHMTSAPCVVSGDLGCSAERRGPQPPEELAHFVERAP